MVAVWLRARHPCPDSTLSIGGSADSPVVQTKKSNIIDCPSTPTPTPTPTPNAPRRRPRQPRTPTPTPTLPRPRRRSSPRRPTPTLPRRSPDPDAGRHAPTPVGAIEIFKIDNKGTATFEDDEFLGGASFEIYLDDGDSVFEPAQDTLAGGPAEAIDGLLTFDNLAGGSYWIVETVVPTGFVGSDPILIDLNLDASLVCLWDSTGSLGCDAGEGPSDVVFVDNTPEGAPTPTGSELPAESERPTPTGGVGGVVGTPNVTPPTTDALSDATSLTSGSWRIVLASLAGLIVLALVFTQPSRARRER